MESDIIVLYDKAASGPLSSEDVKWLEQLTREYPYFSLPYTVLAKHYKESRSTVQDRYLLRAAGYSSDRKKLQAYILGWGDSPVSVPKGDEISLEGEKAAAEEQPTKVEEAAIEPVKAEKEESAPLPEKEESHPDEVPAAVERSTASEIQPQNEEPSGTGTSETKTAQKEVDSEAAQIGWINWLLNTKISLRLPEYLKLNEELVQQLGLDATPKKDVLEAEALSQEVERELKSEPELPDTPLEESPQEDLAETEAEVPTKEIPEAEEEQSPEPVSDPVIQAEEAEEVSEVLAPIEGESYPEDLSLDSPSEEETKAEEPVLLAGQKETGDYQIGAFSSFMFLEENEPKEQESLSAETPEEALALAEEAVSQRGGEIVFEEKDRIVEIKVSPEQLERYFKGRLPVDLSSKRPHEEQPEQYPEDEVLHEPTPTELPDEDELLEVIAGEQEGGGPSLAAYQRVKSPRKKQEDVDALLEAFIQNEPSIRQPSAETPIFDLASQSAADESDWVTETLARIYADQGNYKKAVKIYEKLGLLFPEKKAYFADQISKLKR